MSDRFYDNKGIEHYTKENAEWANQRYLQEEEKAREQGLELQRQQVEATERAARDTEQHRQEQAEAERKRLSELHRQGAAAQRDRDYQNTLLFLKESDEATRLDTFVEILVKSLDWKCCPGYEKGDYDDAWCAEQKKILSRFYRLPANPQECKADGTLTRNIQTLVINPPQSAEASAFLSEEGMRLKAESDKYDKELHRLDKEMSTLAKNGSSGCLSMCLSILGVILLVISVHDYVMGTETTAAYCVFAIGLLLCIVPVALRPVRRSQIKAKQKQLETLKKAKIEIAKKKDVLQRRLRPFLDEASSQAQEQNQKQATAKTAAEQWIAAWRAALVKSFFDQGLWIHDGFQTRLQEVLTEIQKPFPTSCRADVNKLSSSQIESAYKALVGAIMDLFSFKLSRMPMPPGHNMNWTFSYALFPDKNLDYDEYTKQEAVFLEKGVFLKGDKKKEHLDRQKRIITEILMAGPSSPSTLTSNESEQKDDAVGKVHPIVANKSGQKTGASGMTYIKLPDHPSDNVSS
jgi:hypothetical protein